MPGFEWIDDQERAAAQSVFDEGGVLFAHGFENMRSRFHVREFEAACEEKFDSRECLAVSSGTAALKIGLRALGVRQGDEVITQAFNFIATIEAILDCGAKPIIADIDDTLNIDPDDLERRITANTKVILPVHMLGVPAHMTEVLAVSHDRGLPVLEDNCESIGARYKGKMLGTLGDVGAMSFDHGKMITTGEGGLVLSNNEVTSRFCREYHDHGHENNPELPRGKDTRSIYGFNYRMTELQGAIGKIQLSKLDKMLLENKKRYSALQAGLQEKFRLRKIPEAGEPTYDTLILIESDKKLREKIVELLRENAFGTKNLPDAMQWHCAAYWDHALEMEEVARSQSAADRLSSAIAIPIWLRKSVSDYEELGSLLGSLK